MADRTMMTGLGSEVLTPAASIRGIEGHAPGQDAGGKSRRRLREQDSEKPSTDEAEIPDHQLDRMA